MESGTQGDTTKAQLIIAPFEDVLSELLTNESYFNQINAQLAKLDSVLSELGKRIIALENDNGKVHRSNIELTTESSRITKVVDTLVNSVELLAQRVSDIEANSAHPTKSDPETEQEHPKTFNYVLYPAINGQRNDNSHGVAIRADDIWKVTLTIEMTEPVEECATINYLNNQVPLGFAPTTLVDVGADRIGVFVDPDKVLSGYVGYMPATSVEYPHSVTIQMTLK